MWIIDRYLLRQFLHTFLICYLSLTGLYIVFDAFTNLESFLRCADRLSGLFHVMAVHYGFRAIWFFDRTVGLLTLTSAMFTVAWIQRHNELVALLAAGVSKVRVLVPVIAAAAMIVVGAGLNRELVIPRFRSEMARKPQDLSGNAAREFSPQYDQQTDILIRGKASYAAQQRIDAPSFRLPSDLDYYARQIDAREAFYRPPKDGVPGGYLLVGVEQPKDLARKPSLAIDGRQVIVTPRDAPDWLQPDQCFIVSEVSFEQLTNPQAWREFSSTAELIRGLHNPSLGFGANVRVAIHARIVQPALDITLLFLGLPLALGRSNRNVFAALGLCGAVVSVFMLVVMAFQHLGAISVVSPAAAAWAPLVFFVPLAVELARSMNR
jgi:lipopolysaccharide export system permease protein